MLELPWASYRENLSHNLSVTPTISMCDKLIHHTCVLLLYWLIFFSEPSKIQLTMDLCKETIYWFTLCVICLKTLKSVTHDLLFMWILYSGRIASHFQSMEPEHSQRCCKFAWMEWRNYWVSSLLWFYILERSTLPTLCRPQQHHRLKPQHVNQYYSCCCWLVRVYMTLKFHVWGHKPDWWLLGLKIMNQVFVNMLMMCGMSFNVSFKVFNRRVLRWGWYIKRFSQIWLQVSYDKRKNLRIQLYCW
jgi:hypothetical protein